MLRSFTVGSAFAAAFLLQLGALSSPVVADYTQVGGEGALQFDGDDDYVMLGNNPSLRLTDELTVSAWVRLGPNTADRHLGILGKMSYPRGFRLARVDTNKFLFTIGGNGPSELPSPTACTDSEWHHVAGIIQGERQSMYVDGAGRSQVLPWFIRMAESGVAFCVGKEHIEENRNCFEGWIDEVCLYNRALSDGEIQAALSTRPSTEDKSLVGYWAFDEATGTQTVLDASGKGNHGYLGSSPGADPSDPERVSVDDDDSGNDDDDSGNGGQESTSDAYRKVAGAGALEFDGIHDYVTLGNRSSLRSNGDFSVCAWAKLGEDTSGRYMGIAGKMNSNYEGFTLARRDNDKFAFFFGSQHGLYICVKPQPTTDSEWHHLVGVVKDGGGYFYVDGDVVWDELLSWTTLRIVDSGQYAYVGRQYSDHEGRFFRGMIDEVCFYNRGLSAQEVRVALSTRPSTSDPSLVGYWSFNESSGQTVIDESGKGNHGYLGNSRDVDVSDPWRVTAGAPSDMPYQIRWGQVIRFNSAADVAGIATNNNDHYYGGEVPVFRLTGQQPDPAGVLLMQNLRPWSMPAGYVVPAYATFLFTGAGRPSQAFDVLQIKFKYLFQSAEGTLTVLASNGTYEVAAPSITGPNFGQPGGIGSMEWAEYNVSIPLAYDPSSTDLVSLTLELRGPVNTQVLVNDLDLRGLTMSAPSAQFVKLTGAVMSTGTALSVRCVMHRCDIAGPYSHTAGTDDYLAALYNCGEDVPPDQYCVNGIFTDDGVVSPEDAEFWDWACFDGSFCAAVSALSASSEAVLSNFYGDVPNAPLLIAGKAYRREYGDYHEFQLDGLFGFNTGYTPVGKPRIWDAGSLNTRVVKDERGVLYQLNVTRGLVRLSDDQSVLPCIMTLRYNGIPVRIGWNKSYGSPPLQDAAFDSLHNLYVVPVLVTPNHGTSYRAAARIDVSGASPVVTGLYDPEPFIDHVKDISGDLAPLDDDTKHLYATGVHEIEVDHRQNVYVLDKRTWDDSVLLCYNGNTGELKNWTLRNKLSWPQAFHVSRNDGQIFVFRHGSLCLLDPSTLEESRTPIVVEDIDWVTDVTEGYDSNSSQRTIWVVGFSIPVKPSRTDVENGQTVTHAPYCKPYLAKVPFMSSGPIKAECLCPDYADVETEYLSLPLSIVWKGY